MIVCIWCRYIAQIMKIVQLGHLFLNVVAWMRIVKKKKFVLQYKGKNISKFTEDLIWTLYNNHTRDNVYADILKKKDFSL